MDKLRWPVYNDEQVDGVQKVLRSNRWAISGYYTNTRTVESEFADRFAKYNKSNFCLPCTNGSSALLLAMEALDIGAGDEVIVPALTWVACATSVLRVNATPVLADIDPQTLCIDPKEIRRKITSKTKAILVVHLFGSMADMDEILEIARLKDIFIIEDCAQAMGSEWNGKKAGTLGDIGTFSFQQGKLLTAGEGGAVITNDEALFERMVMLKTDSRTFLPSTEDIKYGDMEIVESGLLQGSNYGITEMQCSLLLEHLSRFSRENDKRLRNAMILDEALAASSLCRPISAYEKNNYRTYYNYAFEVNDPSKVNSLVTKIQDELGCGSFFVHKIYDPIHKNKLFCPWTKRRFLNISQTEEYWRSQLFAKSESLSSKTVAVHHSILLHDNIIKKIIKIITDGCF